MQDVQPCEIEGEYKQIGQSSSRIQMRLSMPHKATVPQPAKVVDLACSQRAAAKLAGSDSQLAAREVKGPLVHEGEYMYHVIGCMGTGMLLTTGVNASRLGLASIRSSPEDTHS